MPGGEQYSGLLATLRQGCHFCLGVHCMTASLFTILSCGPKAPQVTRSVMFSHLHFHHLHFYKFGACY